MSKLPTVLFIATALTPMLAQEFVAPSHQRHEISPPAPVITPKPSIEGIVQQIFTTDKPWQLINPAAPASYGSGARNVSKDFGGGTPFHSTGVVVAGVEW
jgi:hypothetical protein